MQNNDTISICKNDLIGIHNALEYACAFIKAGRTQMDDVAHEQLQNAYKQCRLYTNGDPDEC